MNDKNRNKTFHRVRQRIPYLGVGGMAIFMFYSALESFTEGFTTLRLSVWEKDAGLALFVTLFMLFWFGFAGGFARLFFLALETVEVTPEEVRIKIGPLVVRKMHLTEIKTVVRTGDELPPYPSMAEALSSSSYSNSGKEYSTWKLVLSKIPAEELKEMSLSAKQKTIQKNQMERMANRDAEHHRRIKRYMKRSLLKNRFWIEYSSSLEETLRKYLTTTVFIV